MKYENEIIALLYNSKKDVSNWDIMKKLNLNKKDSKKIKKIMDNLYDRRLIGITKKGEYYLRDRKKTFVGKISGLSKTFGFVLDEAANEEMFVRGRDMAGAVPGDIVLAKIIAPKDENNRSQTAAVITVTEPADGCFTGTIVADGTKLYCLPDKLGTPPLTIVKTGKEPIHVGDKVTFSLHKRGERHSEHTVDIVSVFGSCDIAKMCTYAYLEEQGVSLEFPVDAIEQALAVERHGIHSEEIDERFDLRHLPIFTIDGADTKDIDDAISIEKTATGYSLGVHIADVSHYVKKDDALDKEAFERGTSIYIADKVIPMLPKELSNGICSLNPNVDRLAFSCLMNIAKNGEIKCFEFKKSVIRSRVQGVYSEINSILKQEDDDAIKEKYKDVYQTIPMMNELAEILQENRKNRGAPEIDSSESKIVCNADGVCIDVKPRISGVSEGIIEEFMLLANNCAASLAMEKDFPFVYRVHENPPTEKLLQLHETLTMLGINAEGIGEKSKAGDLAKILRESKDDPKSAVINRLVLRTMAKAKYSDKPIGHYGLVMSEYAHFTSPIRRYADLSIHRILTSYVHGANAEKLKKNYTKFAAKSALQATSTELVSVNAERTCEDFYMAEYMKNHIGEDFDGIISGVIANGVFVQLENTIEGRIGTESLPDGYYEVQNGISLVDSATKLAFTIGDKIRVRCTGVNVNGGLINFEPVASI